MNNNKKQSPIVIYRLGSIGDTIVSLPFFHKINKVFPNTVILVLTNIPVSSKAAPLEAILRPAGLINGVIEYTVGIRSIKEILRLRSSIKQIGSNTLIYLAASRGRFVVLRDWLFFKFCGFNRILGIPLTTDSLNNRIDPVNGLIEPEVERLARTLACFGAIDLNDPLNWDLRLSDDEVRAASDALYLLCKKPFFVINMGGKEEIKDWGLQNWHELIGLLLPLLQDTALVVVGGADDSPRAADLLDLWSSGGVNLCGLLSPRESAAVLAQAKFFVGHDSGPLHLAAAVQTPCVGIFGNHNPPKKWHPYGKKVRVIHDMRGVHEINPQQVVDEILAVLKVTS